MGAWSRTKLTVGEDKRTLLHGGGNDWTIWLFMSYTTDPGEVVNVGDMSEEDLLSVGVETSDMGPLG